MRTSTALLGVAVLAAASAGCSGASDPAPAGEVCSGYPAWQSSPYVLPYPVGTGYTVIQGNCSPPGNGHRGENRYAYDFNLGIGTPFVAARAGTVAEVEESHLDGQVAATGLDNYVVVLHADGTAALYGHLTHDGAAVAVGDAVAQGQVIGHSGNTGNTANIPHLHFSVHSCDPVTGGSAACATVPVTFRNTDPNPAGLQLGRTYTALP
jgi:murein DD-endopeptidase MepM/ murein hydrolase activator NlpD